MRKGVGSGGGNKMADMTSCPEDVGIEILRNSSLFFMCIYGGRGVGEVG
jgi:hypothetical protein